MQMIQNQCLSDSESVQLLNSPPPPPPPPSPPTLKLLMTVLVGQGLKQTSSGQCILKAIKSNSIIHLLLFGLKVEIDHATERY